MSAVTFTLCARCGIEVGPSPEWGGCCTDCRSSDPLGCPPAPNRAVGSPRATVAACGTRSGYNRHRRERTPICEDCHAARNAYQNRYRAGAT